MAMFLNRGKEDFEMAVSSKIYVDKTDMLSYFTELVNTEQRYACVSRPRRFGKTMTANMIAAYFDKSTNSRILFENRKISRTSNWDIYLNKFNTITIDIAGIMSTKASPRETLIYIKEKIIEDLQEEYPNTISNNCKEPADALSYINAATGQQFVIVIDEWDAFFRDEKNDTAVQHDYINLLRSLFKDNRSKKFTAFAYITGILPIKRYNSESALNNFREFTMLSPKKLDKYIGFTEDEVRDLCCQYDMNYETVCYWYDGYRFGKSEHIFGPNSVVQAMLDGSCENYWSKTSAFNSIITYITMNLDGLKDDVISMIGGNHIFVDVMGFENAMVNFRSKDDVLTALIHLGYLAYDIENEECYIPNHEIRQIFERKIS